MQRRNQRGEDCPPRKTGPATLAEGSAIESLSSHCAGRAEHQVNRISLKTQSCYLGSMFYTKKINGFPILTAGVFLATWLANGTSLLLSIILPNPKSA